MRLNTFAGASKSTIIELQQTPPMTDIFTPDKRSEVMARIRSTGNKDTELKLMTTLREAGIKGWRRHATVKVLTATANGARMPPVRNQGKRSADAPVRSQGKRSADALVRIP